MSLAAGTGKIRVLFAIGSMGGGGSERQLIGVLTHLDRARFVPALYVTYRRGELLTELPADVPVCAYWDDRRYPRLNWPGRIHRSQVRHFAQVLHGQRIDLTADRNFPMTLVAAPASRQQRVPRVSFVDCDPQPDLRQGGGRFSGLKRRLLRRAYLEAARVVAVSEGVRRGVAEFYGVPAERVAVVPNPIDLERLDRMAAERSPGYEPGRFHVVGAGRFQEQKGFRYLLEAVDQVVRRGAGCDVVLHLLGQGPLEAELQSFVRQRGLSEHVRFEGFQANPFVFFRHADLFCLSSLYEGLPHVLLEALACGVPVLATDCPSGPREALQGGRFGRLVPPADAQSLADALEDAYRHPERWRSLVPAARAHVESHYSIRAQIAAVETLLQEAAAGPAGGPRG